MPYVAKVQFVEFQIIQGHPETTSTHGMRPAVIARDTKGRLWHCRDLSAGYFTQMVVPEADDSDLQDVWPRNLLPL